MASNNAYLDVKIAQIDARKDAIKAELKELDARRKAYAAQKVAEPKTQSDPKG